MIDRIDFLIKESYLIIECNENEFEIIRLVNSFDELESNFQCENRDEIFEHAIDQTQLVSFNQIKIICNNKNKKKFEIQGKFIREKETLKKEIFDVEWPFIHTNYTKQNKKEPLKMKFHEKTDMDLILYEFSLKTFFNNSKNSLEIYLPFVNRPMSCKYDLTYELKDQNQTTCENIQMNQKKIHPICFYQVSKDKPPSLDQLNQIEEKMDIYMNETTDNYFYLTSNKVPSEKTNKTQTNSKKKPMKQLKNKPSKEILKQEKKNDVLFIIIGIICICLILFGIGTFFYCNKSSQKRSTHRRNSYSSYESQY
ncbi:hypothetical protein I4U23_031248 [Adineta vaga]|nr:hypothetical protein I4U23_031248 [Adineta vaga]